MSAEAIGKVKSSKAKTYDVKWNPKTQQVYVSYSGWSECGKASSASEAMRRAEAFLYDK